MAVYKIFASQDSTIYSRFPSKNTGLDEILEVSVKNNTDYLRGLSIQQSGSVGYDDIRRSLIKFSDFDLETLKGYSTSGSSFKTVFKSYIARAENLSQQYTLEFRQLAQSWEMGTGQFENSPETRTGVSWYQSASYIDRTPPIVNWDITSSGAYSYYFVSGGGSWTTDTPITQSFNNQSSKDIEVDITPIITNWWSGDENNGIIIKHTNAVENYSGSYMLLSFFSNDTHTIYPPTLEIRWDDSSYNTGSLSVLDNSDSVITLANNTGKYLWGSQIYKMRINSRDKYPQRVFTTSSWYTTNKALPENSYWSILDSKTNDIVIDFDYEYTKISCDPTSSFFNLYMSGLEPERYYKILIKSQLPDGEVIDWDSDLIFKISKG